MPWFKVDDTFYSSRKVLRIPRSKRSSAVGAWLLAGTWCAHELTDGRIDSHEFEEIGGRHSDADSLVSVGLWTRTATGYQFHDWHDYQPTRVDVLEARAKEAERKRQQRASGKRPGGVRADNNGTPAGQNAESGHPVPSRPDPTQIDDSYDGPDRSVSDARKTLDEDIAALGVKNMRRVRMAAESVVGPIDGDDLTVDASLADLVRAIQLRSTSHVDRVEAYVETTCRQSPEVVQALWSEMAVAS